MLLADRYRVLERLGAGGMGTVMAGEDELLRRRVALKRLHPGGGEELRRALEREARIGASLDHPGIVRVFDVLAGEDGVWIVMELVEGGSLADLLRDGPLPPRRALRILREVADALLHAHLKGVVHRDVKPANVLLTPDGRAKLADLGLARALDGTTQSTGDRGMGSLHYLAPEQLEGGRVDASADTYALAVVAFEALSGRRARTGSTAGELLAQAAMADPPDLRDAWPDAPPGLPEALCRGMARDPEDRPLTPVALVDELEAALRPAAVEPRTPRAAPAPAAPAAPAAHADPAAPPPPAAHAAHVRAAGGTERGPGAPSGGGGGGGGGGDGRGRAKALVGLLLALVVGAGVLVAALQAGDGAAPTTTQRAEATPRTEDPRTDGQEATAADAPEAGPGTTPAATTPAEGTDPPAEAIRALYEAAARQDTATVCAGLTARVKAQFSCPGAFTQQFRTLQRVEFARLQTTGGEGDAATVALQSTARHTDRTDRCTGTVGMVRRGGRWLVDQLGVQCT